MEERASQKSTFLSWPLKWCTPEKVTTFLSFIARVMAGCGFYLPASNRKYLMEAKSVRGI